MKVCGPKYALCGLVISAWGVIQLALMGIFFFFRSVAFIEDVPFDESVDYSADIATFYVHMKRGYDANAFNCWIAACIYVLTFLFSGYQFYVNSRSSLAV